MNEAAGGYYEIAARTLLRLTGSDRQRWLHNFCTADIKALEPGQGCEAFVLNVKGKTIAHAIVLMSDFDLTIVVMGQPEISLVDHLDRYIITEDVQLADIGDEFRLWYACGDAVDESFQSQVHESLAVYSHALVRDRTIAVTTSISGVRDWLVLSAADARMAWPEGFEQLDDEQFTRIRISGRWPLTGVDLTPENLPQEFCRNEQAISFEKGCYLGQETVARIDALGHVNQFFVTLEFQSVADARPGLKLKSKDKPAGRITSIAETAAGDRMIAAGLVRRLQAQQGNQLESAIGPATITSQQE